MDDSAPHQVTITGSAERDLSERLPEAAAAAAANLILGDLAARPYHVGKRLRPPLQEQHSARRGTSRILYEIDDEQRVVRILAVTPRRDACSSR